MILTRKDLEGTLAEVQRMADNGRAIYPSWVLGLVKNFLETYDNLQPPVQSKFKEGQLVKCAGTGRLARVTSVYAPEATVRYNLTPVDGALPNALVSWRVEDLEPLSPRDLGQ